MVYVFDRFTLDPRERRLLAQAGDAIDLQPREFDALHLLARDAGRLIQKATLLREIWPGVAVGDNSVDQLISRLRRRLTDSGGSPSLIATERGRGYRFAASVRRVTPHDSASRKRQHDDERASAGHLYAEACTLSVRPGADNLHAAIVLLELALTKDPGYIPALAHLALLRTVLVSFDLASADFLPIAEGEARRALEFDPCLARGHQALANICVARAGWTDAAHHFDMATRLEDRPDARLTRTWQLLTSVGHLRQAFAEAETALVAAPAQPLAHIAAALAALLLDRNDEARRHADAAAELGWPRTNAALADTYCQLALREGRFTEATELAAASFGVELQAAGGTDAFAAVCAVLAGRCSRRTALTKVREVIAQYQSAYLGLVDRRRLLLWLVMMGGIDDAFAFAQQSFDRFSRFETVGVQWGLLWMTEMRPLRRDSRFTVLVNRLRLPDYWKQHGPADDLIVPLGY